MRNLIRICTLLFLATAPMHSWAQDASGKSMPAKETLYRLEYKIEEMDASSRLVNSRTYIATVGESISSTIKTGTKVPVRTSDKGEGDLQYLDAGVDIHTSSPIESGGHLGLRVAVSISSIVNTPGQPEALGAPPVIRQNSWDSSALVTLGKPSIIFSSDNLDNKGKVQVELTATRLN